MRFIIIFFVISIYSTNAFCQKCNLDSIFGFRSEIEFKGKKIEIGKSVESKIKKVEDVVFSGTSYLISLNECQFYLPVAQNYNDSKFVIGGEFVFVISYVFIGENKKYHYIKEVKLVE